MIRVLVCLALLTAQARANEVKVFPLAGPLPGELAKAPEAMTAALAKSISADVARIPIEDAAGLYECDVETTPCLEKISKELVARQLVFGSISRTPAGKIKVVLTRFDVGPNRVQRTYTLEGKTDRALAEELVRVTGELFGRPVAAENPSAPGPTNPSPTPSGEPVSPPSSPPSPPPPVDPPAKNAGLPLTTYVLVGVGVVALGVGAGYLYSANNLRDEYDRAPNETYEDIQRLKELEKRGNTRLAVGRVLVIGGGVLVAAGIVRGILRPRGNDTAAAALDLAPTDGGASLVYTTTFR
ncbi:MAG TPA: hypothetical protein VIU61_12285 [Kofleriaceae bacterium]